MNRELLMLLKKIKDLFSGDKTNARFAKLFVLLMSLSFAVYTIVYIIKGEADYVDIFFIRTSDLFMDFFNSVRDASQGARVYTVRHVIYPPMANLIYLFISLFIRDGYTSTSFGQRKTWVNYPEAIFINFVFLSLALFIIFCLVRNRCEKIKGNHLIAAFAIVNVPVLFAVERSNIILLAVIGLAVYAFFYDSDSRAKRELALLGLAFSFAIKAYPVIFGWRLLADSRYKDAARCALYGILMMLIPSLFFGGPSCILTMLENMSRFSPSQAVPWMVDLFGDFGRVLENAAIIIGAASFIFFPLFIKDSFKITALGMSIVILLPSFSIFYTWAFMIVPVAIAISRKRLRRSDWFYFVPIIIPLMFFPGFTITTYRSLANTAAYIPIIAAATELIIILVKNISKRIPKKLAAQ